MTQPAMQAAPDFNDNDAGLHPDIIAERYESQVEDIREAFVTLKNVCPGDRDGLTRAIDFAQEVLDKINDLNAPHAAELQILLFAAVHVVALELRVAIFDDPMRRS